MKKLVALSLITFATLAHSETPHPAPANPDAWIGAQPSVRVSVKPLRGTETYLVSAVVTDLRNGPVLAGPNMTVRAGAPAKAEIGATGAPDAAQITLEVTVAADGQTATYASEFRRNGSIVAGQQAVLAVTP